MADAGFWNQPVNACFLPVPTTCQAYLDLDDAEDGLRCRGLPPKMLFQVNEQSGYPEVFSFIVQIRVLLRTVTRQTFSRCPRPDFCLSRSPFSRDCHQAATL